MNARASRKIRRQVGLLVLPLILIALSITGIVANGYWARTSRDNLYALPVDPSAPSMLNFLRTLDGKFEPQTSILGKSILSAIHESVRNASSIIEKDCLGLS